MQEALRARLLATAGVTDLVVDYTPQGGTTTKAIFWVERPQASSLPAITLQTIIGGREYTFGGADATAGSTVQLDCWAASYASARVLAAAVIAALEPAATQDGIEFDPGILEVERDVGVEDIAGGGKIFRVSQDWIIWWREI